MANKGSNFERSICKELSLWWTKGQRDDVFWRSSQSGGRATQRAKKGLRTYGSYGDIAAVDPIGDPLLKYYTIELKRGSTYKSMGDLIDCSRITAAHPWIKCLLQAKSAYLRAQSLTWLLICKRDHRETMVYLDATLYIKERMSEKIPKRWARVKFCIDETPFYIIAMPFSDFLSINPGKIKSVI
jgi:hypothetical protein